MIALFCGGRDWPDPGAVERVMDAMTGWGLYMVVEGEQRGADRSSRLAAERLGLEVLPMPADWERLGLRAGPHRNALMHRALLAARSYGQEVACVAFHNDPRLGSGTRDMVARCTGSSIPVFAWVDPPPPGSDGPCSCGSPAASHPLLLNVGLRLSCDGSAISIVSA